MPPRSQRALVPMMLSVAFGASLIYAAAGADPQDGAGQLGVCAPTTTTTAGPGGPTTTTTAAPSSTTTTTGPGPSSTTTTAPPSTTTSTGPSTTTTTAPEEPSTTTTTEALESTTTTTGPPGNGRRARMAAAAADGTTTTTGPDGPTTTTTGPSASTTTTTEPTGSTTTTTGPSASTTTTTRPSASTTTTTAPTDPCSTTTTTSDPDATTTTTRRPRPSTTTTTEPEPTTTTTTEPTTEPTTTTTKPKPQAPGGSAGPVSLPTQPGHNDPPPTTTTTVPPPFVEQPASQPDWQPGGYEGILLPDEPAGAELPVVGEEAAAVPEGAAAPDRPDRVARPRSGSNSRARFRANEAALPAPVAEAWPRSTTSPEVVASLPGVLPGSLATGPDGSELAAGLAFERGLAPNRRGPVIASGLLTAFGWLGHFVLAWRRRPKYDPA